MPISTWWQAIENLRRVPDDHLEVWLRQVAEDFEELSGLPVDLDLRLSETFLPVYRCS